MARNDKILCIVYALVSIIALFATWINNLAFMSEAQNQNVWAWYDGVYANHAAASFTNDLLFLAIAACIFIAIEGHRLKIRYYWAYILLSGLTAISVTFPLFLIARQIKLSQQR